MEETKATDSRLSCTLSDYRIKRFAIEELREPVKDALLKIQPDACFDPGKSAYKTQLCCLYAVGGVRLDAIIEGDFVFKDPIAPNNAKHAWVNGCTVLYGILRGLYSSMSAQIAGKVMMLPTVMMVDFVNRRVQQLIKEAEDASEKAKQSEPPALPTKV